MNSERVRKQLSQEPLIIYPKGNKENCFLFSVHVMYVVLHQICQLSTFKTVISLAKKINQYLKVPNKSCPLAKEGSPTKNK